MGVDTNVSKKNAYDRMFLTGGEYFTLGQNSQGKENGGAFNPFDFVFKDGEENTYKKFMLKQYTGSGDLTITAKLKSYYKNHWRRNQMSDHFPIWFELITDSSPVFLERNLQKISS